MRLIHEAAATGAALIQDLRDALSRYIIFTSEHAVLTVALWILHTYRFGQFDHTPVLLLESPEKRCGKTRLLSLLRLLVRCPLLASGITAASMFRVIEERRPTLLIDEADNLFTADSGDLRAVLNSGFSKHSAIILRCDKKTLEVQEFNTFTPKVLALISKRLPDTLRDRSVRISMRRKLPGERVERLRLGEVDLSPLVQAIERWARDVRLSKPVMPDALNDREQDLWEPLLAVADAAGEGWSGRARDAALALSGRNDGDSLSIRLLTDIRTVFERFKHDRLPTIQLLAALRADETAPWSEYKAGKPITAPQLARVLSRHSIKPKTIRLGAADKTLKGYLLNDFSDAFARYLPGAVTPSQVTNGAPSSESEAGTRDGTATASGPDKSLNTKDCYGVTAEGQENLEF